MRTEENACTLRFLTVGSMPMGRLIFPSLRDDFVLANTADPDEMTSSAAFHIGLNCL